MLLSIALHNFQAHKDTSIAFDPGINCIVGTSDSGKTSILRGFRWCYENRPTGTAFVSHWCKKEDTAVTISLFTLDSNAPISRIRTEDRNGYDVNGKELGAIGLDVPEEVKTLFNMSSINISSQHDAPFLISETAGEVAKYLNKLIHLDLIDTVLANAESRRRSIKKSIVSLEEDTSKEKASIAELSWVKEACSKIEQLWDIQVTSRKKEKEIDDIKKIIQYAMEMKDTIDRGSSITKAFRSITIDSVIEALEKAKKESSLLSSLLSTILSYKKVAEKREMIDKAQKAFSRIEEFREEKRNLEKGYETLTIFLTSGKRYMDIVGDGKVAIEQLKKELPEICPTCGRTMEECHD
jgi:DNA repair exonuclease SbcCD ATPase subunit